MSLKEMCRVCLRSGQPMSSLFDSLVPNFDSPPDSVVELWKIFTKVLTASEDNYPDKICSDCLIEIQQAYFCMLKCKRSEDILKKMNNVKIRLKTVSTSREYDISKNIKSENDIYSNIPEVKNENIEYDDGETEYDKECSDKGPFQVMSHANVCGHEASHLLLTIKHEENNSEIELLDDRDYENNTTGEVSAIQDIKQEPDLDICTDKAEIYEMESEDHRSTEIVACPSCPFNCRMLESMEKHIIDKHMEGQMCKLCNQGFGTSAIEHCHTHLLKSKTRKQNLTYRVRRRTGQRPFKCEFCSKNFPYKHVLVQHLRLHTGERPFKCESCPKAFIQKGYLTDHLMRCHMGERPFKCKACTKSFVRKGELLKHSISHTVERPFKCESCPKTFKREFSLKEHSRFHTEEEPFKCESCSKVFQCKRYLEQHVKFHTGVRPFKCEKCPEAFVEKRRLTDHLIRRHTRERRFKCEKCSKSFVQNYELLKHLKCHTLERPFKCESCPQCFSLKNNLKRHLRCHTVEET